MILAIPLGCNDLQAQGIGGYVLNEQNEPIPFVNIYIEEFNKGTSTDSKGRYFLALDPGDYKIIVSSVGYKTKVIKVIIKDEEITKNIWLESSSVELNEVVVKAKRKDPAYEIIQKVIDNKKHLRSQVKSYKTDVYVKATELIDEKSRKKLKKKSENPVTVEVQPMNPFENEQVEVKGLLSNLSILEMRLTLNYSYPNKYKEERTGYKVSGTKDGLYVPNFSEADFNFYQNLVELKGIADAPVISPVSRTAILAYKFKLLDILQEGGRMVYKIKVTPRKTSNSTCSGLIYINDGLWNINRLDLKFHKGGLKIYDSFELKQTYEQIEDSLWIPTRQEFTYQTKQGRFKTFKGNTVTVYSNYERDYQFEENFFGNEVAVTTKEAYKRDSSYWNSERPEPLTIDEQKVISYRDSVKQAHNSKDYLDSIQARYNKVTLGEVLIHGIGHRNHEKKKSMYFPSFANLVEFEVIGGWRLGPFFTYFKGWDSGRTLYVNSGLNVGLKNGDVLGGVQVFTRYDPHRLADIDFSIDRSFYSINSFDAYLNQLRTSNYILHNHIGVRHNFELFNGFYFSAGVDWNDRKSIEGLDATSILNEVIDETDPLVFEDYQALVTNTRFSYTPNQKYMTEPNRKVVLGSKLPTFSVGHKKGWNGPFSSDIDFDFVDFRIDQRLDLGIFGNSTYSVQVGQFINTKDLRLVDVKRFRQSDPYLYSDAVNSFQLLDTSLVAKNIFFEAHHIHHFNGALVNNIPLIKKLKLRAVAGAGLLWVKDGNYRHEEIYGGVERVFKLGARRRLRIGIFGVVAESNRTGLNTGFKVSFDIIDTWKREWSY